MHARVCLHPKVLMSVKVFLTSGVTFYSIVASWQSSGDPDPSTPIDSWMGVGYCIMTECEIFTAFAKYSFLIRARELSVPPLLSTYFSCKGFSKGKNTRMTSFLLVSVF